MNAEGEPDSGPLILGVDAGGTKTLALLAEQGKREVCCVLSSGRAGPGNPLSGGFDAATQAIEAAVRDAVEHAGPSSESIQRAVISAAGAANESVRDRLQKWANDAGLAREVLVVPDYAPLLAAAKSVGPCLGVIAGTGSVVFCRDADSRVHRCGGWGYLLGDEGSGYAIGSRALQKVLEEYESGTAESSLTRLVMRTLSVQNPGEAITAVYRAEDSRGAVAALARPILESARQNHEAEKIVRLEMVALASVVTRCLKAAGIHDVQLPIAIAGGVLASSALARSFFLQALRSLGARIARPQVLREPAAGCLAMARHAIR